MANIGPRNTKGASGKTPPELKSHAYAARLHPGLPAEKAAIDYIRHEEAQGKTFRVIVAELVSYRLGLEKVEDVKIPVMNAKQITDALRDILNRLKKGLVMQGTPASLAASEALDVSDDELQQFGRFNDLGIDADEFEDDAPYDEDED